MQEDMVLVLGMVVTLVAVGLEVVLTLLEQVEELVLKVETEDQ